jgi:Cof subfamily protein (haloacid dehalogenase superfamily)
MRPVETAHRLRYRWIVTDLDGTLVDRRLRMVASGREALLRFRAAGGDVVIATGRTVPSARRFYDELGLSGPAILLNGGMVANLSTGAVLRDVRFDPATWDGIRELMSGLPERTAPVAFSGSVARAPEPDGDDLDRLVSDFAGRDLIAVSRVPSWEAQAAAEGVSKVMLLCGTAGIAQRVAGSARGSGLPVTVVTSEDTYVELLPAGCDKGSALSWLARRENVPLRQIAAIGDNPNDIPMLRLAGLGAAVAGGHPDVRAAADIVVGTCPDGAVADVVARAFGEPGG